MPYDIDITRLESRTGKLSEESLENYRTAWDLFFQQIADLIEDAKKRGIVIGKQDLMTKIAQNGKRLLAEFESERTAHAKTGDLKHALYRRQKYKILKELISEIEVM